MPRSNTKHIFKDSEQFLNISDIKLDKVTKIGRDRWVQASKEKESQRQKSCAPESGYLGDWERY